MHAPNDNKIARNGIRTHNTHEALGSVVHAAQLEAALVEEALCQRATQRVWMENRLVAVLELLEQLLEQTRTRSGQ